MHGAEKDKLVAIGSGGNYFHRLLLSLVFTTGQRQCCVYNNTAEDSEHKSVCLILLGLSEFMKLCFFSFVSLFSS